MWRHRFTILQMAALCFLGTPVAGLIGIAMNLAASERKIPCLVAVLASLLMAGVMVYALGAEPPVGFFLSLLMSVITIGAAYTVVADQGENEQRRVNQRGWISVFVLSGFTASLIIFAWSCIER